MSKQNDKNKERIDNNIRISEQDIQMKLYGDQSKPKNDEKPSKGKFSEDIIKNKLYGIPSEETEKTEKSEKIQLNEKSNTIQTDHKSRVEEDDKDLFSQKKVTQQDIADESDYKIKPAIQEEIDALKQAIENLEEKLNRTETQKHKLKVKLIQKRKMINIRERLADLILNKMPEKFILLVTVIVILLVLFMVMRLKSNTSGSDNKPTKTAKQVKSVKAKDTAKTVQPAVIKIEKSKKQLSSKPVTAARKYTIQVAEYADEQAATDFVNDLESKGFEVFVSTIYRGSNKTRPYFKINVGAFNTFNEAKLFNKKLRNTTKITDSFIRETK